MDYTVVQSQHRIAIHPRDIDFEESRLIRGTEGVLKRPEYEEPAHIRGAQGVLKHPEFEAVAAEFISSGRNWGRWMDFMFDYRLGEDSLYSKMVAEHLLFEEDHSPHWIYGLSSFAIEMIYRRQMCLKMSALFTEFDRLRGLSLLQRMWAMRKRPQKLTF